VEWNEDKNVHHYKDLCCRYNNAFPLTFNIYGLCVDGDVASRYHYWATLVLTLAFMFTVNGRAYIFGKMDLSPYVFSVSSKGVFVIGLPMAYYKHPPRSVVHFTLLHFTSLLVACH